MKYKIYKSDVEVISSSLEALEGIFVFPSQGYKLSKDNTYAFSIECIFIDYNANNDKPFQVSFLQHIERLDERAFYAVLKTDEFNKEQEKISSSTYMINVITALNYAPFFITNNNILLCSDNGEPFENHRYGDIDRFVVNGQFDPLFVLLDNVRYRHTGETEYQIKKFETAIIALQWVVSHGFPYNKIIDWNTNKIIDVEVRNALMNGDVPFDTEFVVGNVQKRFCRMIRFGLKEFMVSINKLMEMLLDMNIIDPASSLLFFEIVKEPITELYIPEVQSLSNNIILPINKNQKKPEIFSPAFIITLRISQPEGFTEKFLKEANEHPTILGGMKWKLKQVPTVTKVKQRYNITICGEKHINIVHLSRKLEELRKFLMRILINLKLDEEYLKPGDVEIYLNYLEITIPNINREITKACRDMFNKEFGLELAYSKKFKKLSNPDDDQILFRFGFGMLSYFVIDWYTEKRTSSNRLRRCDPFTKAAITHALSGNYLRGEKLLNEVYELFSTDRNFDMPKQFCNYIQKNETELTSYLTKSHPMSFMSNDHYVQLKKDVEFFIFKYYLFEDIGKLVETAIKSQKIKLIYSIHEKLTHLGVYEEKNLSYLDDVCQSISLFFGAQYRKSLQS